MLEFDKISNIMNIRVNFTVEELSMQLHQNKVIAYPTESVFGLGCNPDSEVAVYTLLNIKRRSWKKGLILVAANYNQLLRYIDDRYINNAQKSKIFASWPGPVTWVFPAQTYIPYWLRGQFSSTIAVRISNFKPIQRLCLSFGKPLVSTSANISGCPPVKTILELRMQLKYNNYLIMNENVLGLDKTSEIRDAVTGQIIRR